jgi:hypothetical protein
LFHLHLFYFSPAQALRNLIQTEWVFHVNGKCLPVSHSKWKAHNPNGIFYPKFCLPLAQFQTGWVFHVNGKQPQQFVFDNTAPGIYGTATSYLSSIQPLIIPRLFPLEEERPWQ